MNYLVIWYLVSYLITTTLLCHPPFRNHSPSFLKTISITTPHEFIIHLGNPTVHPTSQFLSLLLSFNFIQHVNLPTHNKTHILELVITSSDSSLAPSLSSTCCSPFDHFPVFTNCLLAQLVYEPEEVNGTIRRD